MSDNTNQTQELAVKAPRVPLIQRLWRRMRAHIKSKPWFSTLLVNVIYGWLTLVHKTNTLVSGSAETRVVFDTHQPVIIAMWHGQHFLPPFLVPKDVKLVALFSKSADAEANAKLVERLGFETVRGSGGRDANQAHAKGGAKALIAMKRALESGKSAVMIADISKSTPRQSGLGVITLARLSGRPIVGVAYASSRRRVLEKSWDKATLNLPFGRACLIATDPLYVARDATETTMRAMQLELDKRLNTATEKAYKMVDERA